MDPIQDTMELMDAIQNRIDWANQLQTTLYQLPVPASMPNGVRSDIDRVAESIDGAKRGLEAIKVRLQDRFSKLTAEKRRQDVDNLKGVAEKGLRATGRLAGKGFSALGKRLSALEEEPSGLRQWVFADSETGKQTRIIAKDLGDAWQNLANSCCDGDVDLAHNLFYSLQVPRGSSEMPSGLPTVTYYTGGQSKTYTYDPRLKQFRYLVYGKKPEYIEPGNPLYDELMDLLRRIR